MVQLSHPYMTTGKTILYFKEKNHTLSSDSKESAYNAGDPGLIPGLEDPLEKRVATHSSIPAWRIPWTEEPAGCSSWGCKESDMTE